MAEPDDGDFAWTGAPAPSRVMAALNAAGEARYVGGCVRDSLLGRPPRPGGPADIDIATDLEPQESITALRRAGIKVVPTGLDHGTVTAITEGIPFEVTTLRRDVATDGRHAEVAFTTDWAIDASRRDFTVNALYRDSAGRIADFHGGRGDLARRIVRFIGAPEDRIAEDYLRILRFLRFSARFCDGLDEDGWRACVEARQGLARLSVERIWHELHRLFVAPRAPMALGAAEADGVLAAILPDPSDAARFARVHEKVAEVSPPLGLAALWPEAGIEAFRSAFRPAGATLDAIETFRRARVDIEDGQPVGAILYAHGRFGALGGLALARADGDVPIGRDALERTPIPVLPFRGQDLIARGYAPGPQIGATLRRFERAWIAAGFPMDEDRTAAMLEAATGGGTED